MTLIALKMGAISTLEVETAMVMIQVPMKKVAFQLVKTRRRER